MKSDRIQWGARGFDFRKPSNSKVTDSILEQAANEAPLVHPKFR